MKQSYFSIILLAMAFTACAETSTKKNIKIMSNEPIPTGIKTDTATFGEGCFCLGVKPDGSCVSIL